ncbi:MAG: DUF3857 domain-containing protein, partial [Gelidibacter sp.]|nr:DUF3857 domain-containing protein [Gelidibacter sp.]
MAQSESLLTSHTIPDSLRANANAVVRYNAVTIEIKAYNKMLYTNKRIVTILNSSGNSKNGAYMSYDNGVNIKQLEAKIYNANGKEIKKIRKNDFEDVSAVDGGTLYSDSRVKYLNYTPIDYPYTILFETEVEYSNTAYVPSWMPIEGYYIGVENSSYKFLFDPTVNIKKIENNFKGYNIINNSIEGELKYEAHNIQGVSQEAFSPPFDEFAPLLNVALQNFYYEGYQGNTDDWKSLGKWMYDNLLVSREVVSESTKQTVLKLVEGIDD